MNVLIAIHKFDALILFGVFQRVYEVIGKRFAIRPTRIAIFFADGMALCGITNTLILVSQQALWRDAPLMGLMLLPGVLAVALFPLGMRRNARTVDQSWDRGLVPVILVTWLLPRVSVLLCTVMMIPFLITWSISSVFLVFSIGLWLCMISAEYFICCVPARPRPRKQRLARLVPDSGYSRP